MNFRITKVYSALALAFLAVACADGIDDSEKFSGGVTNTQMKSPVLEASNFSTITNPDGSESVKVVWDVVFGAGGYLCNVSIVDDPANPVKIITDSVIDGCSVVFDKLEDTKYEVSLKTLGNDRYNNTDAESPTVYAYSTLVPALTVPAGQEISQWIASAITTATPSADGEFGFELIAGETYHLDAPVDFELNKVTFRGDKANRPTVIVGENGCITTQAGLKVKFVNFDCTGSLKDGLLLLSDTPSDAISTEALGYKAAGANQNGFVINDPIIIQDVMVKGLNKSLLHGNKTNWSLRDFRMENCIVQANNGTSNCMLHLYGASNGLIKNMSIKYCTFLNLVENNTAYFLRYSNSSNSQPRKIFGDGENSTSHSISYCTFSKTFTGKDFANNLANTNTVKVNVDHCIFYDVYRIYQFIPTQSYRTTNFNTIIGVSNATNATDIGGRKDSNGNPYAVEEDPQFVGPFDQELDLTKPNGGYSFRPTASYATENKIGDPRWYE